ncbi:YheT family hydrolase [Pararobbsia silviterrae]|uniref:Alpha/beta fold hydrolase n=1 Tax=Pararobbsia silviterrae TaxID=1792498 RepID=A0A494YE42_9BURK|nr:alpha/beta fold hydrolase [Pararobbsia silviterrae]RKP58988.1 alpha/beta fold hydrolase [Pararobbsia silviterrae]
MNAPPIYASPRWLPSGHLQTIVPAVFGRRPEVAFERERWNTPDGDFIDLDHLVDRVGARDAAPSHDDATRSDVFAARTRDTAPFGDTLSTPGPHATPPLLVLFHGLEGSSSSHYALTTMASARAHGWRGVVPHFRSCSGSMNLAPRFYHSGDSAEIDWILRRLRERHTGKLFVAGVSLGGNALLRWLGERGREAARIVDAAAAISAPVDIPAGGHALSGGINLIYARSFLKTMKVKSLAKHAQFPGLFDVEAMLRARTLHAFDDIVTGPLHGFRNADDYWNRASSIHVLGEIEVPTLVLNARNDPFLPARALPTRVHVSPRVELEQPDTGGHVGFMTGAFPGRIDWLGARLLHFFGQFAT